MQRALQFPPSHDTEPESGPAFNVVIAYEDFENGKHAKQTYDFLVDTLGRDCAFSNQMWKFDVLAIPKLREIALRDAQSADILMISCAGRGDLPGPLKDWLEAWSRSPSNALALVALFRGGGDESVRGGAMRLYLKGIAQRAGVEFFAQPGDWPVIGAVENTVPRVRQRELDTIVGAARPDFGIPRWGINE